MSPDHFMSQMGPEVRLLMTGKITTKAFWDLFAHRTNRRVEGEPWGDLFHPIPDKQVLRLLTETRKMVRVVAGTNTIAPHFRVLERDGYLAHFDAVYASHILGVAKPDPQFYLRILTAEGCPPSEALFIDDCEENVIRAREVGLNVAVFRSNTELRSVLQNTGLISPPENVG